MTVKVAGLIKVPSSANYELKGQTTTHPDNHYIVNQTALDSLTNAANAFRNQKWNNTGKMKLNDLSLEWGGLFDLDANWSSPHKLHRLGKSIDIENITLKDTTATFIVKGEQVTKTVRVADQLWLREYTKFMRLFKWHFVDEKQTTPDVQGKVLYPHFEWKGN